jgi:hypothetical protein
MADSDTKPFDKDPAEGSRDVVERELKRQERADNKVDHLPGVKVSGQPQGGAVDRARDRSQENESPYK